MWRRSLPSASVLDVDAGAATTTPAVRAAVDFRVLNLLDEAGVAGLGAFDAILCRHVLISFRDTVVARVLERLRSALAPGGLLAVGVSESLLRFGTALVCEERGGSFFYRSAR